MTRRRRIGRRRGPNLWVIVLQIMLLVILLIAVLGVTDSISSGTSALVDTLASDDLAVGERDGESLRLTSNQTEDE